MTNVKNEDIGNIIAGPNELQMIMSLMHLGADAPFETDMAEGTAVKFTVMREAHPNEELWASIQSIQREDGSGHKWNIGGYVFDRVLCSFNGYYNSKTRKGTIKLEFR